MGPGYACCDGGVGRCAFLRSEGGSGGEWFGKVERLLGEIGEQAATRDARYLEFADADLANAGGVVDVDSTVVRGDREVGIVLGE